MAKYLATKQVWLSHEGRFVGPGEFETEFPRKPVFTANSSYQEVVEAVDVEPAKRKPKSTKEAREE